MNIFIYGCGFLGTKLADFFLEHSHLVTVTTTSPERVQDLEQRASEVVLLNEETDLKKQLLQQDVVIVCVAPKTKEDYKEAYLASAEKICKALDGNAHVKTVLYTSSCSVYGDQQGGWVDETHPLLPLNEQQTILMETEKYYLTHLPKSIKCCLFRLGEIYGLEKSMSEKIRRMSGQKVQSNGESYTNLIHVTDIVRAINWAIYQKISGVYNLCNDSHEKRKDFYHKWCNHLGVNLIEFDSQGRSLHRGSKRVSNHKIKLMGFQFSHPLTEPNQVE